MKGVLYDPYGKVAIYTGTWSSTRPSSSYDNVYLHTGREYDPETGFYHYRTRYYTVDLARFLSRDPMGYGGGVNHYEYVESTPVTGLDPLGERACIATSPAKVVTTPPKLRPCNWNYGTERRPRPFPPYPDGPKMRLMMITYKLDPRDVARLKVERRRSYKIQYDPPTKCDPCPDGKIMMVQAVSIPKTEFDGPVKGLRWPQYPGPKPGRYTIIDSPYNPWGGLRRKEYVWKNTVCAVCVVEEPFSQKHIGCINFTWYDQQLEVQMGSLKTDKKKKRNKLGASPADLPGPTWKAAERALAKRFGKPQKN